MSNLMTMLYTGVSGLFAAQTQIAVSGHNTANINTEGYTRQRVNLGSVQYKGDMNGAFGSGVRVQEIIRVYDETLARAIRNESSQLTYWKGTQSSLEHIKVYFNEIKGTGLGGALRNYFNAWEELSSVPAGKTDEANIKRTQLLDQAGQLCTKINDDRQMFEDMKREINSRIEGYVEDINNITKSIAELNKKIVAIEATGKNANDLRDTRDLYVNRLAEIVHVSVVERKNGEYGVFMSGQALVDGPAAHTLGTKPSEDGKTEIVWKNHICQDSETVITEQVKGGYLQAEIDTRDKIIVSYIKELDELARTLIVETNKIHVSGQGVERFSQLTSSNKVENVKYTLASAYGHLPYNVQKGTFEIIIYDKDKNRVDSFNVDIDPSIETLEGIAEKISDLGNEHLGKFEARINKDGSISFLTQSGYTFAFGEDTSNFLVSAGFNNFFSGTDSSSISLDKHVEDNPHFVATGKTGKPGDNEISKAIAKLNTEATVNGVSIDHFYGTLAGKLASDKQQVDIFTETKTRTVKEYLLKFQDVSGVSKDEEVVNLAQYQRIFEANSRFVNAVDEMLELIVNRLGLVGR